MLNFAVGPVTSEDYLLKIAGEQVPYFRTPEFSQTVLESEKWMTSIAEAPDGARALFITGSGTAAMEAVVMNAFTEKDKVLVVKGGSFGARFSELCDIHGVPHDDISVDFGGNITQAMLAPYAGKGYTGFLINVCETSTGVLYDMGAVSRFCRAEGLFLVADAISSFLSDPFHMASWGVDIMITGSQKALACQPGISVAVLSPRAIEKVQANRPKTMYFDFKSALKNAERGQTPFTPAVGVIRQIHAKLKSVNEVGVASWIEKTKAQADDFRRRIAGLPFEITSTSLSNTVTPLHPLVKTPAEIVAALKNDYGIWVCPNGGTIGERIFRVGHIGALAAEDNETLVKALRDVMSSHC